MEGFTGLIEFYNKNTVLHMVGMLYCVKLEAIKSCKLAWPYGHKNITDRIWTSQHQLVVITQE